MHQIKEKSAVNNHFVDGSLTQEGTVVNADWLNTIQDEICFVITLTGLSLNDADNDDKKQLYKAIGIIIQKAIINLVNKNDLIIYVKKDDLNSYATKIDLNNYIKISDIQNNAYMSWCVKWIEHMNSIKYPNLP